MTWQPIGTAPKDGTRVLLCSAADSDQRPTIEVAEWDAKDSVWACGGGWFEPDEVSHWMPELEEMVNLSLMSVLRIRAKQSLYEMSS